ncbi:MAG: PQQ-binding-like beta-propeller repeat protein [Candidatus Anammoximicrobium sp.]|nr:PQQ-binding-like beta-propeller repeat protein [Candidatus Anammoximicrobium sp.]
MSLALVSRFHCRLTVLAVISLLATSVAAHAADWPQWGGRAERNMVSDETGLPETFSRGTRERAGGIDSGAAKNVKWVVKLGSATYGNPTIAAGRVYVGTDDMNLAGDERLKRTRGGLVQCFDEQTGKLLWRLTVPQRTKVPPGLLYGHQHLGVCSSPTVDGDRVYVVTCACEVLCLDADGLADGNDGPFDDEGQYIAGSGAPAVKLDSTDADIVWRCDLIDALGVRPHDTASCSVLIHGSLAYLSTSNGVNAAHDRVLAPQAPAFVALNKHTGRLAAYEDMGLSSRLYHCAWCSPTLGRVGDATQVIVGGGDGVCYAFEAIEGLPEKPVPLKKLWSYDCNPPEYKYRDGKLVPYYAGDKRKKSSPNRNDGQYLGPSQLIGTPVCHEGRVYIALGQDPAHGRGKGMLHCIDATKRGDINACGKIWSYDGLDRTIATAAVADGLVYIVDIAGRLHCVDADTGKCQWVYESKAETWGGPLVADGKLYFGSQKMFYVMAAGRAPRLLSEIKLGNPMYTTPVAANGVLYVASQHYLWAVQKLTGE